MQYTHTIQKKYLSQMLSETMGKKRTIYKFEVRKVCEREKHKKLQSEKQNRIKIKLILLIIPAEKLVFFCRCAITCCFLSGEQHLYGMGLELSE